MITGNKTTISMRKWYPPLYGQYGVYEFQKGKCLPYFSCTMTVERFSEEITIADEGTPNFNRSWNLEEIFQRELDTQRVQHDILNGYLLEKNSMVFFNAITVVLTPKQLDSSQKIGEGFEHAEKEDIPLIPHSEQDNYDAGWKEIYQRDMKGIQLNLMSMTKGFEHVDSGRLRWSPDLIDGVAVDGQHRLAAIREWGKSAHNVSKLNRIPVIFILAGEEFGYTYKDETKQPLAISHTSRRVFTNLNKHARNVDKIRGLILDDTDLKARVVRSLITSQTQEDSIKKIPLTLMHWQTELLHIDANHWHLNTISNIENQIQSIYFSGIKEPDPTDPKQVIEYLEKIESMLKKTDIEAKLIDYKDGKDPVTLKNYYKESYCIQDSVTGELEAVRPWRKMPSPFVDACLGYFEQNHQGYIHSVLTELTPYSRLISYCRHHDLIEGDFGGYHAQTTNHKKDLYMQKTNQVGSHWMKENITKFEEGIKDIKGKNQDGNLLWAIFFQRGVLAAAKELISTHGLCTTGQFICFMNKLIQRGVFTREVEISKDDGSVWRFFAFNKTGAIRNGKSTTRDVKRLVMLWFYASKYASEELANDKKIDPKDYPKKVIEFLSTKASNSASGYSACNTTYAKFREDWPEERHAQHSGKVWEDMSKFEQESLVNERISLIINYGVVDNLGLEYLICHANAVLEYAMNRYGSELEEQITQLAELLEEVILNVDSVLELSNEMENFFIEMEKPKPEPPAETTPTSESTTEPESESVTKLDSEAELESEPKLDSEQEAKTQTNAFDL